MSNVIIPSQHQSAPKATPLDKAIRTAAEEIHSGAFQADTSDFFDTGITADLAQHPRVVDALRTLETQVQEKTSAEFDEKRHELHEMNERSARGERWDGQERWQGKENIAMRTVNPMTPQQFIEKLCAAHISAEQIPYTVQEPRFDGAGILRMAEVEKSDALICLGRFVVRGVVGLWANVDGEYKRVDKLQVPCGPEWDVMRFDEYNVPTNKAYHGWRTALLALIRARVLTEEQAHQAFGKPIDNAASLYYRQQLAALRNGVTA